MTREEHLGVIGMEECNEVGQRISKALRFGRDQVQPGQSKTNRERVEAEFTDLCATLDMLDFSIVPDAQRMAEKRAKVETFLAYSVVCGTLTEGALGQRQAPPCCDHCGDGGIIQTGNGDVCATCYHPIEGDPIAAAVDAQLDPLKDELIAMGRRLAKGTRVELPSPKEPWPDPTLEMLEDPRFEAIWQRIKSWDINVPSVYGGYCGATGNHVRAILDALVEATR
jgi:hypothetical protein